MITPATSAAVWRGNFSRMLKTQGGRSKDYKFHGAVKAGAFSYIARFYRIQRGRPVMGHLGTIDFKWIMRSALPSDGQADDGPARRAATRQARRYAHASKGNLQQRAVVVLDRRRFGAKTTAPCAHAATFVSCRLMNGGPAILPRRCGHDLEPVIRQRRHRRRDRSCVLSFSLHHRP
jgi:hypothetical protein